MGILDDVLRPHLEQVTRTFHANESTYLYLIEADQTNAIISEQEAEADLIQSRNSNAESVREHGNTWFKKREFFDAIKLYTESIASAREGPIASLAYSNRSAAFFQVKFYEDCIKDIDRSLAAGYPKLQNLYLLYVRKAKCQKFLKKDYADCLADAFKAINLHNKDDEKKLSDLVKLKIKEAEPVFNVYVPKPNNDWKLPELSYGQNPEVPAFSSAVLLEYNKKLGRHLIANRDIKTGDALVVEESFVSIIFSHVHDEVCNFCFKFCLSLIPCTKCGDSLYCSEKCRETDWSRAHNGICNKHCPFTQEPDDFDVKESQSDVPPSLTVLIHLIGRIGLDKIRKTALENKPMPTLLGGPRTKGFQNGKFQVANLEAWLSLEDLFNSLHKVVKQTVSHIALAHCINIKLPREEWLPVAAILTKLFLVIQNNLLSIFCYKVNYDAYSKTILLGNSLNLASSLINHSCAPNMYQVSYGTTVVFRAMRPISKGEQLTFSYSKLATTSSYAERQKELYEAYKFKCTCVACIDKYPTLDDLPEFPPDLKVVQWMTDFGINDQDGTQLMHFCNSEFAATKQMLPNLITMLQCCHDSGHKLNRWYYNVQTSITNYFRTKGSCLFLDDAKEILSGEMVYDMSEVVEHLKQCRMASE